MNTRSEHIANKNLAKSEEEKRREQANKSAREALERHKAAQKKKSPLHKLKKMFSFESYLEESKVNPNVSLKKWVSNDEYEKEALHPTYSVHHQDNHLGYVVPVYDAAKDKHPKPTGWESRMSGKSAPQDKFHKTRDAAVNFIADHHKVKK